MVFNLSAARHLDEPLEDTRGQGRSSLVQWHGPWVLGLLIITGLFRQESGALFVMLLPTCQYRVCTKL